MTRVLLFATAIIVGADAFGGATISLERLVGALNYPLYVTHAPGDPYHLYIVERPGRIRIYDLREGSTTLFLDINPRVIGGDSSNLSFDGGLLGLAFHPGYQANGYFYVHYVDLNRDDRISRFTRLASGAADPDSELNIALLDYPVNVGHRGGWLGFSPIDGFLYLTLGDGSNGNDSSGLSQRNDDPWGSVLRIDVDGADGPGGLYGIPAANPFVGAHPGMDEVWAWGLRNPWRASFDRATGDLWIGDVGQSQREEINLQLAGAAGGANYGWPCFEGDVAYFTTGVCDPLPPGMTVPLYAYAHGAGSAVCSVTGGYVYRGAAIPELVGAYCFGDYCTGQMWSLRASPEGAPGFTDLTEWTSELVADAGAVEHIVSFGEDAFGELYIVDFSQTDGEIFRVVPAAGYEDCNANNVADASELAAGLLDDSDGDGIPDPCDPNSCGGDANGDGIVNFDDISAVIANWLSAGPQGDADASGQVNFEDISAVIANWLSACP